MSGALSPGSAASGGWGGRQARFRLSCGVLGGLLVLSAVLCVGIGPVGIPFDTVWRVLASRLLGAGQVQDIPLNTQNIVFALRAPRVLLAMLAGACLSLSGVAMQAFTQNPLASPYVLGVSSGASFGAVLAMATGVFSAFGAAGVPMGAFLGSLASILAVYLLARTGREVAPIRLVLVGMGISALFTAFANFVVYKAPEEQKVRNLAFWALGSLASAQWSDLVPPALALPLGLGVLLALSKSLNAMMMGQNSAVTLGIEVNRDRTLTVFLSALLTGTAVAVTGCIGFVGLIIPHLVRGFVGADHRRVIPLSALGGALFLMWADVLARMVDAPGEMPIGILTSLIGAPFFLSMLRAKKYTFGSKT